LLGVNGVLAQLHNTVVENGDAGGASYQLLSLDIRPV
jgi:hypothetical protein